MPIPESDVVVRRRAALGANLKKWRAVRRMTQERLALAASIDRSFYVDVENGKHSLTVDRLFAVADALGVKPARLLDGID